jgi:hypothetical protein
MCYFDAVRWWEGGVPPPLRRVCLRYAADIQPWHTQAAADGGGDNAHHHPAAGQVPAPR